MVSALSKAPFIRACKSISSPLRICALLLFAVSLVLISSAGAQAPSQQTKKVLIFAYEQDHFPGFGLVLESINSAFKSNADFRIQLYKEGQDSSRIPNDKYEAEFVSFLHQKYSGEKIDLIFVVGLPALAFLNQHEKELFPHVPRVFILFDAEELTRMDLGPYTTGISGKIELGMNVELMLAENPGTKRIVVVTGRSKSDRFWLEQAHQQLDPYKDRVDFFYPDNFTIEELRDQLSSLPRDNLVFYISMDTDSSGRGFHHPEGLSIVAPTSSVPIYTEIDTAIGTGALGGVMFSWRSIGDAAAQMGLRILAGQDPQSIPREIVPAIPMFDWRELRRFGIDERSLPAGSIVEFRTPTAWEQYRGYIVTGLALIILQSMLIVSLVFTRARRRKAEQRLNEVVANVPGIVWESHVEGEPDERRIEFISDYVEKMLGYTPDEIEARPNFWMSLVLEEDREALERTTQEILGGRERGVQTFRCVAKNGDVIWIEAHLVARHDETGKVVGIRGVAINVTERKKAEEKLGAKELLLVEAQRLAQVGSWEWEPETNLITWSDEIYRIYGLDPTRPAPAFVEHEKLLTPKSWERLRSAVTNTLETGEPYELELEIIRTDGNHIWGASRGEVFGDSGLRGTLQDITGRKDAEIELKAALDEVNQLQAKLQEENINLREVINLEHNFDELIGHGDALKYVLFKIEQVAPTDATVLIAGETGTGKELVARAIHNTSLRKDRPLVTVNCAALSASLIESELFGHERGAFTGAAARKIGRFELADKATIFLDEIGELPIELQAKLLRVIQEGEFERLGNTKTIKVDVRIIAATNRSLESEVRKGAFREDLLFRLNVFPITVPPLRDRKEDIPELVEYFTNRFSKKIGKQIRSISPATIRKLAEHSWPGNIRELANVIERSVIGTQSHTLQILETLGTANGETDAGARAEKLEVVERDHIVRILESVGWRIEGSNGAARILGLNPSTLRTRMVKLNISRTPAGTVRAD